MHLDVRYYDLGGDLLPFVAICKECNWVILSKRLRSIGFDLENHFRLKHDREPYPNPWRLNMEDFKSYYVELDNWSTGGYYNYNSKIFYSYDYCIAVITNSDFDLYKDDSQPVLFNYFTNYFPKSALQKDKTMLCIKELDDISDLNNKDLENLLLYILIEFKKRNLLEKAAKVLSEFVNKKV